MQYLYVIKCNEYHKIGIANDIDSRLAQLSTGNPYPLKVVVYYGFDNAEIVERSIHQKYKNKRNRGEWFSLDYDDLNDIHRICLMLGGSAFDYQNELTEEIIEDAEESHAVGDKFDYAMMFRDGWRMAEQDSRAKYWNWRRGSGDKRETIYGGTVASLPYPIEEMRTRYGK